MPRSKRSSATDDHMPQMANMCRASLLTCSTPPAKGGKLAREGRGQRSCGCHGVYSGPPGHSSSVCDQTAENFSIYSAETLMGRCISRHAEHYTCCISTLEALG